MPIRSTNCSSKQAIQVADHCWQACVIDVHAIMLYSGDCMEINGDAPHKEINHTQLKQKKVYIQGT